VAERKEIFCCVEEEPIGTHSPSFSRSRVVLKQEPFRGAGLGDVSHRLYTGSFFDAEMQPVPSALKSPGRQQGGVTESTVQKVDLVNIVAFPQSDPMSNCHCQIVPAL
jgi:hypothetical protein